MMDSSPSLIPPVSNSHSSEFSFVVPHLLDISIKLASTNYLLWKAQVIPILRGNSLLSYVQNQVSCPSLVKMTLYGSHTRDRLQQMKGELQLLNKGDSSLEDYLHKAKSLALSLRGAGKPMDDDECIICILRGLGSEFDPIMAAFNARDVFSSLEGVIGKLYDFKIHLQATPVTPPNVAFFTNRGRTGTKFHGTHGSYGCNITHNQTTSQFHQKDACFHASLKETEQFKAFTTLQVADPTEETWSLQIATVQSIPTDSLPAVVNPVGHEHSSSPHVQNSTLMPQSTPCQEPPPNTVI
ncbi:hypothetical protein POTOM_008884 [Populus tomentosa]|uniref:Retrotransposon Copia-like N-terminal domain-containing protein n=1 Tax=Populus tomentosa TaxID=118781 RepID=A0A8X8AHT7_POPTO|nr:hypothetical protein POTOM_008884 [Populus tomentosa]